MRLENFFNKFDQFADVPEAVPKVRELVLHLAFSGKLLRTTESWPLKTLKSLTTKIGSGATPAGGRESYFTQGIPLIRSMNVHFAGFEPKGLVFLSDEQAKQLANVTVRPGDVLLNITGASIGRVTTAPPEMTGARVNQHVAIVRPTEDLDPQFLAKFLASPTIQRMIDDIQVGATREALTKGMIEQFEIPLPPLAEQKRIVAKVDELMALCDRLEAQQQERETRHAALARASLARFADAPTPANLQFLFHPSYDISPADLRKSILSLAVQGKLVPQDPSDEPADALLEAIQAEKLSLVKRGLLRRADPIDRELYGALPVGWSPATLAEMCVAVTDGDHLPPPKAETGVPFLVISNVRWGGIDFESCRYVAEEYFNKLDWIRKPVPGDVLYTLVGSFGIPVLVGNVRPFCVQRHIGILRPSKHVDRHYLAYALASGSVLQQVTAIATGIAQKTVPLAGLRRVKVPLPPLAEQRRIVAKVEQLMALVDALESQLAASRAAAANLLTALVAELTQPA